MPTISDLGSINGTSLDTPRPLAAGDLITIGTVGAWARHDQIPGPAGPRPTTGLNWSIATHTG